MADEKTARVMREFPKALETANVDKVVSLKGGYAGVSTRWRV